VLLLEAAPDQAGIRYRERVRPIRSIAELVRAQCDASRFSVERIAGPEAIVTAEGEHGALVTIDGMHDGVVAQRTIGYVFADDFYAHVSGLAFARERFAPVAEAVRRLTLGDTHMLGIRRRRFQYRPPAGWRRSAQPSLFHDVWAPPGGDGTITVCPALPAGSPLAALGSPDDAEPVVTRRLAGPAWTTHAERSRRLVVLNDGRYQYPLLLECAASSWSEHVTCFDEVVESAEPVPMASGPRAAGTTVGLHWAD
jgi:hypothetical protein